MPRRTSSFRKRNAIVDHVGNDHGPEPVVVHSETKMKDYRLLYRAALGGYWELAENYIFSHHAEAYTAPITGDSKTVLHVAAGTVTKKGNHFVRELVKHMTIHSLELRDDKGETALSVAAAIGNLDAAMCMIHVNHKLPYIPGENRYFPIHRAAQYVQREMVEYLLDYVPTYGDVGGENPYEGESGFLLLKLVISAGFYDIALKFIDRHGELLSFEYMNREDSPIALIAGKPEAFLSGTTLNFWQRWVYAWVDAAADEQQQRKPREIEMKDQRGSAEGKSDEIVILVQADQQCNTVAYGDPEIEPKVGGSTRLQSTLARIREFIGRIGSPIRKIRRAKANHLQLFLLIEKFCDTIDALDHKQVEKAITRPLFLATKLGIHELVETIVMELPTAMWLTDKDKRNALQIAIMNRHEKVFSVIYHMSHYRQLVTRQKDKFRNNTLHMAAKLAPSDRLSSVPGPALQMQRDLQWFKTVEKCVEPSFKEMKNGQGKTPTSIFLEEHKQLVEYGEKWMKETAQSCTVVASLIATVVFAASITVPGGNDNINTVGLPTLSDTTPFAIFIVATAVSLFSSVASVLIFLSVLTTRYTIDNFLYTLPNKLSMGLFTLFLSVTTMLVAFSASLYLVVASRKLVTVVPLLVLSALTVTMFVFSQCHLLWRMLKSTYYSRSILCKKNQVKLGPVQLSGIAILDKSYHKK